MSDGGFVRVSRRLMDRKWYGDSDMVRVYLHILLSVNDKDSIYGGEAIKKGSFYTSCEGLARKLGLTVKSIKTALSKLEEAEEIEVKSAKRGVLITLIQWDIYLITDDGGV